MFCLSKGLDHSGSMPWLTVHVLHPHGARRSVVRPPLPAPPGPPRQWGPVGEVSGMVPTKPYSILITDDDRGCREALRDIFEPEGFRTLLAESGEEAVD